MIDHYLMVIVKIKNTSSETEIYLEGHTGISKKGQDIVCAGISATLQFLIIHFFNNLKREGYFHLSDGKGIVKLLKKEDDNKIINSFLEYLKIVEKSYPNAIKIHIII